jgi:bifunctional DNA-binding transcriptional regulator/antitoxin component of YhaV-PrlF toxin-antitoxin module
MSEYVEIDPDVRIFHAYPMKKDGSVNEIAIKNLMAALEMEEFSFDILTSGQFHNLTVQVVLENQTYEGKTREVVRYMNSRNRRPGLSADPEIVKSLDSKYKAAFAQYRQTPSPTQKKPVTPAAPAPTPADDSIRREVWAEFKTRFKDSASDEFVAAAEAFKTTHSGKAPMGEQWRELLSWKKGDNATLARNVVSSAVKKYGDKVSDVLDSWYEHMSQDHSEVSAKVAQKMGAEEDVDIMNCDLNEYIRFCEVLMKTLLDEGHSFESICDLMV